TVGGKVGLIDATGMHAIRVSEGGKIVDQTFVFDGKKSYFELESSANFSFDGPFAIEADIQLDNGLSLPADIITVWKTSAHQRSFRLGVDEGGAISFYWSTDGRADDAYVLTGPVLDPERMSKVIVDRGDSGILRLYVDGTMVARSSGPVQGFYASNSLLRVSGRSDGKQAAAGKLGVLTIVKGYARCDSDDGCPAP
ncbi:MAG: LamG-like jellyroll fold domain-containing protein, partial [Devosia sp.]